MNVMKMMQQAQNIQKRLKETQEELANTEITGESAGVVVTCDGQGKFKSIKIPSIEGMDAEMLEDVIAAAIKSASDKATKLMDEKMKAATGGISIPGLS